ncbi:MAG: transglutaminase family protein [Duodenibacillus sp.]|nr:transglutaminase family protein [Duodenibacillus sp.]
MKLAYRLQTTLELDAPVSRHAFRLRALPFAAGARQRPLEGSLELEPRLLAREQIEQPYLNRIVTGSFSTPHQRFSFVSEGVVLSDPDARDRLPCIPYAAYPSPLTRPGPTLAGLLAASGAEARAPAEESIALLTHAVHAAFAYAPGSTSVETTAEQALAQGRGVCQDYAHALLALLRMLSIPALYVTGLVDGIGATHAWVQAWTGRDWLEVDPTHDRLRLEGYVMLARGLDFASAAVERGVFRGAAGQRMATTAAVSVIAP